MQALQFGIDTFIEHAEKYKHLKFGLVTNDVAKNNSGIPSRVVLAKSSIQLVKLFSPEHGLNAKGADGSFQANFIDAVTNLPVISLYGEKLQPSEEDLTDIDAVIFDIPDVGCRFYTYLWTMTYMMEACAQYNKLFFLLDRPNPIGINLYQAEGPMLDEKTCSSFIGRWNIPIRHSCTFGELAKYFAFTKIKEVDLQVIEVNHLSRNNTTNEPQWNFIPTSPAITDLETALLYPCMGLLEGININEGRGTNVPFKIFGAPWIDATFLLEKMNELNLSGIKFSEISYTPNESVYAQQICNGLKLEITSKEDFKPVLTGLKIIAQLLKHYTANCTERLYKTVANPSGSGHLNKLTGVDNSLQKLKEEKFIFQNYNANNWQKEITPFLLY
ncbi:MAG: DUF1343 domain-containing protein [Bacteroidetes bacterium]|nr:DUF1343 domain-containing protein [Bacteroidota bacterium]